MKLLNGRIRSAALDVHYEEPLPQQYALAQLDSVILTPHIAGLTYEAFQSMMLGAIDNIEAFEKGEFEKINNKKLL